MFLWLLVFNQWRRLLPMHLGAGLLLFLAVAAPWHILAAQRNPRWAEFYFIHEHWTRFTTTTHGRQAPFWFFGPVILAGLFPWVGFLPGAVREAIAGGWRRRQQRQGEEERAHRPLPRSTSMRRFMSLEAQIGTSRPSSRSSSQAEVRSDSARRPCFIVP